MAEALDQELATYELHKAELLSESAGKYVLIKEDKIIGVFDVQGDAIRRGYEEFGNEPFLVKKILQVETPENFTSNLIDL